MITETGKNLTVLIATEPEMDWQTFATWYSFHKNLPDAEVMIVCYRNKKTPFEFYQWTKRLKIQCSKREPFDANSEYANWLAAVSHSNTLVVKPLTMALSVFDHKFLENLNIVDHWICDQGIFLRDQNVEQYLNRYYLDGTKPEWSNMIPQAKEENNPMCLVNYSKGCGRWINTSKGCPLSSAAALVSSEMTINEHKIIELWKKMVPLFDATV